MLQTAGLRVMTQNIPAFAHSFSRVVDLQALSVSTSCLEFGRNDCKVILQPHIGYVPKVFSTPFRANVISLLALLGTYGEQGPMRLVQ